MNCSNDEHSTDSQGSQKTLPFHFFPSKLPNNLNAMRSTLTMKSIDFDSKSILQGNEHSSNLTVVEQKQIQLYVNHLISIDSNQQERKSISKNSYKIPSPTILLPNEFPSITASNMIPHQRHSSDNHRNRLTFTQSTSFHLRNPDKFSRTSIDSLNLVQEISSQQIQTTDHEEFITHRNSISSTQFNLSMKRATVRFIDKSIDSSSALLAAQVTNGILSHSAIPSSDDSKAISFKFPHDHEKIFDASPFEISPQMKLRSEIKPESESLWKTKLTLKTLLAMANRDEAQALKHRKPIDYHMFLSNKLNKSSIFQYDDHIDRKFTAQNKRSVIGQINEENYRENRKLYKRLLNTMGQSKPRNTKKPIKQRNIKRRPRVKSSILLKENALPSSNTDSKNPVLITYQAVPISVFNK